MLSGLLITLNILVCISLIGVVLLQRSEGGAFGMGGGPTGLITTRGAGDLLTRTTWILFGLFLALSLGLTLLGAHDRQSSSLIAKLKLQNPSPTAPSPPTPTPAAPVPAGALPGSPLACARPTPAAPIFAPAPLPQAAAPIAAKPAHAARGVAAKPAAAATPTASAPEVAAPAPAAAP